MFLKTLLFLTAVAAFTIPPNAPDGLYTVSTTPTGEEHIPIPLAAPSERRGRYSRRQVPPVALDTVTCLGYALDAASTNNAFNELVSATANGYNVAAGSSVYFKSGTTVAYCCNRSAYLESCVGSTATDALQGHVTQTCGSFWAGSDYKGFWAQEYGYQHRDDAFC